MGIDIVALHFAVGVQDVAVDGANDQLFMRIFIHVCQCTNSIRDVPVRKLLEIHRRLFLLIVST